MAKRISDYYPRQMRRGWCVAHTASVAGIEMERYGQVYGTFKETCIACNNLNKKDDQKNGNKV